MSKEIDISGQLSAMRNSFYGGLLSKRNPMNAGTGMTIEKVGSVSTVSRLHPPYDTKEG
jgi:hypothetical protein